MPMFTIMLTTIQILEAFFVLALSINNPLNQELNEVIKISNKKCLSHHP